MGVGKEHATLGQPVDVGGLGLGMTLHATDPVVQVVDGDEEGVGLGSQVQVQEGEPGQKEGDALHVGKGKGFAYSLTLSVTPPIAEAFTPLRVLSADPSPTLTV